MVFWVFSYFVWPKVVFHSLVPEIKKDWPSTSTNDPTPNGAITCDARIDKLFLIANF